jgi:nucleoside-diphosphate-sugar epimerase
MLHTVLGAGGTIAKELGSVLPDYTPQVRWVSRHPQPLQAGDQVIAADLTDAAQTLRAVEGSAVAYLVAGLKYNHNVWREQWPAIMRNVIKACKQSGTKLVFFDNVYSYGKVDGWMTEDTPVNPSSRKGDVRARIAQMLLDEVKAGNLEAMIVRAADFHGAGAQTFMSLMVYPKLIQGKKASWLCNAGVRHSFTYTPDAARATAMLANTATAYHQVWHLPTARDALTGEQYIHLCAEQAGVPPRYRVLSKGMMRLAGLFDPLVRESVEMLYQYEREYLFDSGKFERAFNFTPTPYPEALRSIMEVACARSGVK